ncbi:MAG: site-specific DNA-methyltransferase [Firmicutes bacterium]|nr:site-specific DNA-methyltransferase [Bacillota bacterium]
MNSSTTRLARQSAPCDGRAGGSGGAGETLRPPTNRVFLEDCLEGMRRRLPDGCVDVIVTSPPYNIGVRYHKYVDKLAFDEYRDWLTEVMRECARVLSPEGSIFLNLGQRPSDGLRVFEVVRPLLEFLKLQNTIHWIKSVAAPEFGLNVGHYRPVQSRRYLHNAHEYIFHLTKTGAVPLDILGNGCVYADKSNIGRYAKEDRRSRGNTWYIPYGTVTSAKPHPASFPDLLPEWCIRLHGLHKTGLVLDPFMGVGSTAVAAKRLGVAYVGFEVDPAYLEEALRRLERTPGPHGAPA